MSIEEDFFCLVEFDPRCVNRRMNKHWKGLRDNCGKVYSGAWHMAYSRPYFDSPNYKMIHARFVDNLSWCDTETKIGHQVTAERRDYIDALYHSIKEKGFIRGQEELMVDNHDYIRVHIGPFGEIIHAKEGNHRLSIAKILDIERVIGRIYIRHDSFVRNKRKPNGNYLDV